MSKTPRACFFTNFSCGLFRFDIEWQASNNSAQSTKGNQAILSFYNTELLILYESVYTSTCTSEQRNESVGDSTLRKVPKMKIVEYANTVDPDEVAHHEPPHLDLHSTLFVL